MNLPQTALVVTSIAGPNEVLRSLAGGAAGREVHFFLMGDAPSPPDFSLSGCDYYSLDRQARTDLRIAELLPTRHYARKNIGYLLAGRDGAEIIVETDDDNLPRESFWGERRRVQNVPLLREAGWVNVYRYFTDALTWPRGLPLDEVRQMPPAFEQIPVTVADCPIQQGLADDNPDVDAIYRLVMPLPISFRGDRRIALGKGAWCPFNSQNTTCWRAAFPLLYLPSTCTMRMTDIWRGFVAQRIGWENGWSLLFHEPTVTQLRNDHDLLHDFRDEVPGYLHNREIADRLSALSLQQGREHLGDNLLRCYEALVQMGVLDGREMGLVEAWCEDWKRVEGYTEN
jgi:hypothetical protein